MRNLGPAVASDLHAAGITYADEIIALGPKKTFLRMLDGRKAIGRSTKCCNACYLYAFYGAIHDLDWRDTPEEIKDDFKAFTAELRAIGKYK